MKKNLAIFSLCTLLLPATAALAQGPGSSGALFLLIAPGARAAGMGESFVSIADDATATYWNPAGMAFLEKTQIALMHSNWLPQLASDLYYDYATMVRPMGNSGTAGVSLTFINLGNQIITDETGPEPKGEFSSYELALAGSYAAKLGANNSAGVTLKFIYSNLAPQGAGAEQGDGRATAFAVDLGYLHRNLLFDRFNMGVNVTNIGPKISYIDAAQADPLPTNLRLGVSYQLIKQEYNSLVFSTEVNRLLIAFDDEGQARSVIPGMFLALSDESFKEELKHFIYNAGAEYWYNNLMALRIGYHYDKTGRAKYTTFGAGLKYSSLKLDFGYISAGEGHPLSETMRLSLAIEL